MPKISLKNMRDIVKNNSSLPTLDEELGDDLDKGSAAVINKLTEVSNTSGDAPNLVSAQEVDEQIKEKGISAVNAELNKQGRAIIATDNNPLVTQQGQFITVNKSNSYGFEIISLTKARLLMEILDLKQSLIAICPKILPIINTTFAVYYTMSEVELQNYKQMLREMLDANLLHENMIYFLEFIWNVVITVSGHKTKDKNTMVNLLSSPMFKIVAKSWFSYWISPSSITGRTIILTGTMQNAIGSEFISLIESTMS